MTPGVKVNFRHLVSTDPNSLTHTHTHTQKGV